MKAPAFLSPSQLYRWISRPLRRAGDERGVIAVIAALVLTLVILAAALSVDIAGRVYQLRRDQATADLAALDSSRDLSSDSDATALAVASALRNNVDTTKPKVTVSAVRGTVTNGVFSAGGANTAVKVTVSTPYNDFFGGTSSSLVASAVATNSGLAQFSIGSTLAEINLGLGPFGSMRLNAVGYNGLATGYGTVTLGALATQLGFGALTPDQVLASTVSVGQLVNASSSLLSANDPTASASLASLGALLLAATFNSTNTVTLGQALGLQQGNGVGLGTNVSLLGAVGGAIQIANQKAGISSALSVSVGTLTSAGFSVTALVPPTISPYGPVGISATNTQVTVTLTINLNITVGVNLFSVSLPLSLNLGGATGTLEAIDCTGTSVNDLKIGTTFQPVNATTSTGSVKLLGLVVGSLSGSAAISSNPVADTTVLDPANFVPNQTTANVSSSLGGASANFTGSGLVGGLTAATLNAAVVAVLPTVVTAVGTTLSSVFGINVGNADYLGIRAACATPSLVK